MNQITNLKSRSIIEVCGEDRKKFLQGLITNNINKANLENLIYAAMLNSSGRFLYDFFIFEKDQKLILDCFAPRRDEIFQKLNFYKLRSKVELKKNDEIFLEQNFLGVGFVDPRSSQLGYRNYQAKQDLVYSQEYHFKRIAAKIPESELDLTYEKSLILEFGFDELNAIDYQKGCYVGQELTARTHHLGQIRKKIFHVKILNKTSLPKNSEITCQGKVAGIILSSVFFQDNLHALALIKLSNLQQINDFHLYLEFEGSKIFIIN
jgi:folate-binding protein YgfZ